MANLIARIAVLLVLAAAGMVLADRKEKIDLSVSLLLFLAAINVTSFFSLKDNRIVVVMILTVYFPMQKCRPDVFEFFCKFKKPSGQDRTAAEGELCR